MSFEVVVNQFLRACDIKVDQNHLAERLRAHPDYPALSAFTDILDDWQLEYSALQLEPADLEQMEFPFLAHIVTEQGLEDFKIVKDRQQVEKEGDHFLRSWTGIVVWVAPKSEIKNQEHADVWRMTQDNRRLKWLIASIGAIALTVLWWQQFNLFITAMALLSAGGIIISGAIIGYVFGIDNVIAKSFCKITENGCHNIIHSSFSKPLPGVHLSDLALAYFIGLFLTTVFLGLLSPQAFAATVFVPIVLSFLVSIASLVYQTLKGNWCKMCLGISGVIWLQVVVMGGCVKKAMGITVIDDDDDDDLIAMNE